MTAVWWHIVYATRVACFFLRDSSGVFLSTRLMVDQGKECQRISWPTHKPFYKLQGKKRLNEIVEREDHPDSGDESDGEYEKNRKYPPLHYSKRCNGCLRMQRQLPPGMILKDCKACRTVQYCGHECQKQDWNSHKSQCRINSTSRARQKDIDYPEMYDDLMKFSQTFKAELVDAAAYGLKLQMNPNDWKTHIFEIWLRYVPWRKKGDHRFDIRGYAGRKISDLNEPELERLIRYPEMERISKDSTLDASFPPILRIVMRAEPYNAKKRHICYLREYVVDPDLGRWNPNWEYCFRESIKLVQAGAPKLRTSPDKLDPRFKKRHYCGAEKKLPKTTH
ncbi:hypothetical protein B0H19DRAFT_492957 [Mycena capillaripes]|nr:hypothetical protein B0H19DRAFT_492957 [Mycena capillaripes]